MIVYLHDSAVGTSAMAHFNAELLPTKDDEIILDHDGGGMVKGKYVVLLRRFSAIGDDHQRIDYYLRCTGEAPTDYTTESS